MSDRGRDRASRPAPVFVVFILVLLLQGAGAQVASAQTMRVEVLGRGGTDLWIEPRARLEPVSSFDFPDGAGTSRERAAAPLQTSLSGSGRLVTNMGSPPTGEPITVVRRELGDLWRLQIRGSSTFSFTRVDYDVIGANGRNGVFSHTTNGTSVISVRVVELPLRYGNRPGGLSTVEGGVMLEMDLGQAVEAGHYAGSLRVTVVQL